MGQSNCGRRAAALAMMLLGLPPAFAMDRVANEAGGSRPRPCPTRFDYLVLASFADAPSLLSLSTYHFRSEVGFSSGRRIRADQGEVPRAVLVPDDVSAARHHDGGAGEQARGR
jgi:hypothetical protein